MEGETIRQFESVDQLSGMKYVAAMPDGHPGKGGPVGGAFASEYIHPTLVGSDIGCGIALWITNIKSKKAKCEKIAEKLNGLDSINENFDSRQYLEKYGIDTTIHDITLGTPGHGNHFCEIQKVNTIFDNKIFKSLNLTPEYLYMLVHSGSRGLGETILRDITSKIGSDSINLDSNIGQEYIKNHNTAVIWAKANRDFCANKMSNRLKCESSNILDICHNSVTSAIIAGCNCWLHRKGAAPSNAGPVMIPGSRGDFSYLVLPNLNREDALWSIAHGAGRKIARGEAKGKLKSNNTKQSLTQNKFGGKVICGDDNLIWEEAPECYKNIDSVVADLVSHDLINVIASFEPLVTFKTSEGAKIKKTKYKKDWKKDRTQAREEKYNRQTKGY